MRILIHNLSTLLILLTLVSCSNDDDFIGSGNIISENREVASFTKIDNSTSINMIISKGPIQEVEVSADDNIINSVKTAVENGLFKLDLSKGNYIDVTITVSITVPNIEDLENTGSGNMTISGFDDLLLLRVDNEGSGNITLSGSGTSLDLKNSGSGSYKGFGFVSENCSVANSGSGDCEINCTSTLDGTNSGSGNILYTGMPNVNISNTGSGEVVDSN